VNVRVSSTTENDNTVAEDASPKSGAREQITISPTVSSTKKEKSSSLFKRDSLTRIGTVVMATGCTVLCVGLLWMLYRLRIRQAYSLHTKDNPEKDEETDQLQIDHSQHSER